MAHRYRRRRKRIRPDDEACQGKGTLIFIDGSYLFHLRRILDMNPFRWNEFYRLLTCEISAGAWTKAYYVAPRRFLQRNRRLFTDAGFHAISIPMRNAEDDDRFIRKRIEYLRTDEIAEIILVGTDGGYASSLIQKYEEGIEIVIVGTNVPDPESGNSPFSTRLWYPGFRIVEVAGYAARLTYGTHCSGEVPEWCVEVAARRSQD